jgi:hypothetical protein
VRALAITGLTVSIVASTVPPTVLESRTADAVAAKLFPSPMPEAAPRPSQSALQPARGIDWPDPAGARIFLRGQAIGTPSRVPEVQPDPETSQRRVVQRREFARAIGALEAPWSLRIRHGVLLSSSSHIRSALRPNPSLDPAFASALGLTRWRVLGPGGVVLFESTPR